MSAHTIPYIYHRDGAVWLEEIPLGHDDLLDLIAHLEIEGVCAANFGDAVNVLRVSILLQELEAPMRAAKNYWRFRETGIE